MIANTLKSLLGSAALALALVGPVQAEAPSAKTVVAVVGGTEITLGHMIAMRAALPDQYQAMPDADLFNGILEQLIQQEALAQVAAGSMTDRDTISIENDKRAYLASTVLDDAAKAAITDEAVQKAYDAKYSGVTPGKEYSAAHILVKTKEEAEAIKADLDKATDIPAAFAEAAKAKSTDGSAAQGGDLGWFAPAMMVEPFAKAVEGAELGKVVGPVESQFGFHLILVKETRIPEAPKLEEVRPELMQELQQAAVKAKLDEVTAAAKAEKKAEAIDPALLRNDALLP